MSATESFPGRISSEESGDACQSARRDYDVDTTDSEFIESNREQAARTSAAAVIARAVGNRKADWGGDRIGQSVASDEVKDFTAEAEAKQAAQKPARQATKNRRPAESDPLFTYVAELKRLGERASILTAEAEVELAKRIEAGVFARKALEIIEATREGSMLELREDLENARYARIAPARLNRTEEEFAKLKEDAQKAAERHADEVIAYVLDRVSINEGAPNADERMRLTENDLKKLAERGAQAVKEMIEHNLRLALTLGIRAFYDGGNGNATSMDVVTWANDGLFEAVKRFDYRRGYKFSTFADAWIRKAIGMGRVNEGAVLALPQHIFEDKAIVNKASAGLRKKGLPPTIEAIAKVIGCTPHHVRDILAMDTNALYLDTPNDTNLDAEFCYLDILELHETDHDPTANIVVAQDLEPLRSKLLTEIRRLPFEQQQAIILWYGLDGHGQRTQKEVGEILGVSRRRIQERASKGFDVLRECRPDLITYLT